MAEIISLETRSSTDSEAVDTEEAARVIDELAADLRSGRFHSVAIVAVGPSGLEGAFSCASVGDAYKLIGKMVDVQQMLLAEVKAL